jgi:hypothetical protein
MPLLYRDDKLKKIALSNQHELEPATVNVGR